MKLRVLLAVALFLIGCRHQDFDVIAESFNKADSSTLGPDLSWVETAGNLSIVSGAVVAPPSSDNFAVATNDLGTADHYSEIVVKTSPTAAVGNLLGATARANTSDQSCYAFLVASYAGITYRLFRRSSGGTWTQIGSSVSTTLPTAPYTVRLEVVGSTLRGLVNNVEVISETDATITTATRAGIYGNTSGAIESFAAGDFNDFAVTFPADNQPFNRLTRTTGEISITCTGTFDIEVEARFDGGEWQSIGTMSGGTLTGTLTNLPTARGDLEVRYADDDDSKVTVDNVSIGATVLMIGQSNMAGYLTNAQTYTETGLGSVIYDAGNGWRPMFTGYTSQGATVGKYNVLPLVASKLELLVGCPLAFIESAKSGDSLYVEDQDYLSTLPGASYTAAVDIAAACGSAIEAVGYDQGERDATLGVSQANYQTALENLIADWRTDTGNDAKWLVTLTGTTPAADPEDLANVRNAQQAAIDGSSTVYPGPLSSDRAGLHWETDEEADVLATRWANALADVLVRPETVRRRFAHHNAAAGAN